MGNNINPVVLQPYISLGLKLRLFDDFYSIAKWSAFCASTVRANDNCADRKQNPTMVILLGSNSGGDVPTATSHRQYTNSIHSANGLVKMYGEQKNNFKA